MNENDGARVGALVGVPADLRIIGTRHGFRHLTGTLADGRGVFVKAADGVGAADAFAAEANGLRWLALAGAVRVPAVLGADEGMLVIELLPTGRPTPVTAWEFGAALARTHAAGAPGFGAPWPGYIASLPLDNTPLDNTSPDGGRPATRPGRTGGAGTRSAGWRRTCGGHGTAVRCRRPARGRSRKSSRRSGSWPGRPSRRAGSTAICGRATCSGRTAPAR